MSTKITVVSTFTVISGSGQVELGCFDVQSATVRDIKQAIEQVVDVEKEQQTLWWKGYKLDDDNQVLMDACRGVEGEEIPVDVEELVLFLTTPVEHYPDEPSSSSERSRSSSFEMAMSAPESVRQHCVIL